MISRDDLATFLYQYLAVDTVEDYCPNGLQVEGKSSIKRIVTGVTASQAFIDQAIAVDADAILVHHGFFWHSEPSIVTGMRARRLKALLTHDINLFAYHLPLDIHPDIGNNAQFGGMLSATNMVRTLNGLVWYGDVPAMTLTAFADMLTEKLQRTPIVVAAHDRDVNRIAWCTGGGQRYIDDIDPTRADTFISGEISEQTTHIARECGINYIGCGHHASERYGIRALGAELAERFDIEHLFIHVDNPA